MRALNILGLLIAALGGAAVGLERQWSGHGEGPGARIAGIRTFTMLGAVGGLSGWLWTAGATVPAGIVLAGGEHGDEPRGHAPADGSSLDRQRQRRQQVPDVW